MNLIFLGTGGAWRLPELNCNCFICREARKREEERGRTALLLSGKKKILIDCGPDIARQLSSHQIDRVDAVLITHEHGDHYLGLDELVSYKRSCLKESFEPIPVYLTGLSWNVIGARFGYLEEMGVIKVHKIEPGMEHEAAGCEIIPFKTNHGPIASGSVGYIINIKEMGGEDIRLIYTSDLVDPEGSHPDLFHPDYLIISSYWFNEPIENRANHLSFQRALDFIKLWSPERETFLVHIGDGDVIPGDPANRMAKKIDPADPLSALNNGEPYAVPMNQEEWQKAVDMVVSDQDLPFKITVAYDDLIISL
ncbi:MBL fold metallo-hydrolase [Thermodesulfobacteriota bacterium]